MCNALELSQDWVTDVESMDTQLFEACAFEMETMKELLMELKNVKSQLFALVRVGFDVEAMPLRQQERGCAPTNRDADEDTRTTKVFLNHGSAIRGKIAELLRLDASESENGQFSLKEYVDLMKVQMRDDLIKDLADLLNKRIDELTAQHHGLSQRVAQLESRQHVIVDEARRGQDRGGSAD